MGRSSGSATRLSLLLPLLLGVVDVNAQSTSSSITCAKPADPTGVAVDDSGSLYVLDPGEGVVHEFESSDGEYVGSLSTATGTAGGGLKVAGNYLFVAPASDSDSTVLKIDLDSGALNMTFPGEDEGVESLPPAAGGYDVAVDAEGSVYVSNYVDVGVKVYDGTTGAYKGTTLDDTNALGLAFGPDDILFATVPEDDTVRRFERAADGSNFTFIDAPIVGSGGSRVREGAWGIHINQAEYLVYVVWAGSKEITEYTSDAQELRYWSSGAQKMWWTTDPDTSRSAGAGGGSGSTSSSSGWASVDGNSTDFTPWFVTTDSAGNIYVTASDETEDGVDRDVFKYDGESGSVIGRLSNCLGAGRNWTETPTATPTTAIPTTTPSMASFIGLATISPTSSPTMASQDRGIFTSSSLSSTSPTAAPTAAPTNASEVSQASGASRTSGYGQESGFRVMLGYAGAAAVAAASVLFL